jgi:hypothetical protein
MRKALSVYAVIALLLLLIVSQAISIVSANPWFTAKQIDPPPDAIPPIITINSPQSNTIYSGAFNVSFSVKGAKYSDYFSDILDVTYIIDNETVTIPHSADVLAIKNYDTSFIGPNLTAGNHSLTVKATGIAYKLFNVYFIMERSSQVYFVTSENRTSENSPTSSPLPPTVEPSQSPQANQPIEPNYYQVLIAVACVVVVVGITLVSMIYFKRRKSKTA